MPESHDDFPDETPAESQDEQTDDLPEMDPNHDVTASSRDLSRDDDANENRAAILMSLMPAVHRAKLRPEEDEVWDLVAFAGMSVGEAAAKLGKPYTTINDRLHACMSKIRKVAKNDPHLKAEFGPWFDDE